MASPRWAWGSRLCLAAAALTVGTGCAASRNPTFDPTQNKPVVPGGAATRPGEGAGPGAITARGAETPTCLNGWVSPAEGASLRAEGLGLLARSQGVATPTASDVRFFLGPDTPGATPAESNVSRWYLKVDDPALRGRFLVEKRVRGSAAVAVAPYESSGWAGAGWTAFRGDGPAGARPGLAGNWAGTAYDAVSGRLLPASVVGCVDGS